MLDLLKYRYLYLFISGLIIVPGIIFLFLGGLKPGIDFTGGSELTILLPQSARTIGSADIETVVRGVRFAGDNGKTVAHYFDDVQAQGVTDPRPSYSHRQEFLIRTRDIGSNPAAQSGILDSLASRYGKVQRLSLNTVGGSVGRETTTLTTEAVSIAALAILLYMAFAFRRLQHPFVYGAAAIAALLHDVLVVLGLFAILGYFFNVRIDALFVPAVLTIIGFSVHDTIVVFDRIRENILRRSGEPYYTIVNNSLAQTLGRSLNTSLTVLLTLAALFLFGGATIHIFVLTLLIGIASGTYSSIFNATPLAVIWETGEFHRLFRGGKGRPAASTKPRGA